MIKRKAFTLSEIFVAMIILGVLVAVSIAAFSANRKDYSREYLYYTAYQTIVKVVDNALMNEDYLNDKTLITKCGYTYDGDESNVFRCRAFKPDTDLKSIFEDYTNYKDANNNKITLSNGMILEFSNCDDIFFNTLQYDDDKYYVEPTEWIGCQIIADIDGDKGENIKNYDWMMFFVTLSGRVVPMYGTLGKFPNDGSRYKDEVRGKTSNGYFPDDDNYKGQYGWYDGAGNNALIAFDVVYTDPDDNLLKVVEDGRSVSFPEAACMSGYIHANTGYCKGFKYNNLTGEARENGVVLASECDPDDENYIPGGDCYPRLVQKMKWTR